MSEGQELLWQGKPAKGEKLMSWQVHLAKENPRKTALLSLSTVLFMAVIIYFVWGVPLLAVLSLFVIITVTAPYSLPNKYLWTTEGVYYSNVITSLFRPWKRFRDFTVYPDAVYMNYSKSNLRNRVSRGHIVYFRDNREQAIEIIKQYKGERATMTFVDEV